jgi:transcription termination factor Rho
LVVAGFSAPNQCAIGKAKRQRISRRKEAVMTRIIEFYVPVKFQRRELLVARSQKGKVIVFCAEAKKPA